MSRALEDELKSALLTGQDSTGAFQAISQALRPPFRYKTKEIEILPQSHELEPGTYLLEDGAALAVSKLALLQAFAVARPRMMSTDSGTPLSLSEPGDELLASSAVVLLVDPEHLTAANIRKRTIVARLTAGNRTACAATMSNEKQFTDSLLTSRLVRHTKSPTLWNHRRWLLELSVSLDMPLHSWTDFRDIIMVSGERHPRNYYAWNHARWLTCFTATNPAQSGLVDQVKSWCLRHHTDVSGWSFLSFSLSLGDAKESQLSDTTLREVLNIAGSLRWTNESVWVFLRGLAASKLVDERSRNAFRKTIEGLRSVSKDAAGSKTLVTSLHWYEDNRPVDSGCK